MGRGLSAILAPSHEQDVERGSELRHVPVELISPNPRQPRREFDEGAIVALSESLRERGVLQPVLVRPVAGGTYELIAGERRWRAARLAGFDTVIPRNVRLGEAPSFGRPVIHHDPYCAGSEAYFALAKEVASRG